MQILIYFIAGGVVGIVIGILWVKRKKPAAVETTEPEGQGDKVMKLFLDKDEIKNNDIEELLGVSDSTATRILDALEKEGKIVQDGHTGRGVVYRKV
ncbi:MAG: winged helix-turn-helix transcriptional regulator [Candidatus Jacksonbacteria bacterium]|jgi:predicted HTH transcriptional regulator|nr:winged helix-turn-helix transcriptional regulator [Candidatus Jacksonbacteria bacterium]MBT6301418.1 winged helix-turn-helix transcriptional regulator [Candidatus Jacksonbacteria bacterium]MBT6756797.1 winged helix-turn-helix transcriptional regulator [Candidatus Jacksonbacteria bacterium]MBT6954720.1 winged helix-turn-helix transcriptional regulator [Candidatus Jacksonbacteria bacterium]